MIYTLADSGTKLHKDGCRYQTPAYPLLDFASVQHARRWATKQKRALCARCEPLGEGNQPVTEP